MTRAMLTAMSMLSLFAGCGGEDESAPRTTEGSCAEFCEKYAGAGCTDAGVLDYCMQRCEKDVAEYPDCEDELNAAWRCFARAEVQCIVLLNASYPQVVGEQCNAANNARDACRQAAMPGSGANAGP